MILRSFKFRVSAERSCPFTHANYLCDLRGGRYITNNRYYYATSPDFLLICSHGGLRMIQLTSASVPQLRLGRPTSYSGPRRSPTQRVIAFPPRRTGDATRRASQF